MMDKASIKRSGRDGRSREKPAEVHQKRGSVLGYTAFEKISAVEGMTISRAIKRDIAAASADHLSPAERSRFILAKYGKE